jgi:hypothetical protein
MPSVPIILTAPKIVCLLIVLLGAVAIYVMDTMMKD